MISEETAMRVDEAHPASSAEGVLKVEMVGVEPVPEDRRHGRPWSLFTLWLGANVQFATLSVGALSTSVFGLDLVPAVAAILLGVMLSSALIGLLSTRGPRTGVPQLIQTRGPFGWFGNLPAVAITVVNGVGWFVVDTILGVFILRDLLGIGFAPALLIMVAAQLTVPVLGYRMIHVAERVLAAVLVVVFVVLSVYGFGQAQATSPVEPFAGTVGAFLLTVSVTSARSLGWATYTSDYSRYLPAGTPPARVFAAAAGGSALAGAWVGVLGAAIGTIGSVSDPSSMVSDILPAAVGTVVLLSLLASTLASTILDLYSGAMAALVAGVRIPRWASVVGVCAVGATLTWFAGQFDFASQFQSFLLLMSTWLAPWTAVTLVAFWWRAPSLQLEQLYDRRHRFGWGLPATLLGVAAALPFMNQTLYTGPVAAAHPGLGGIGHLIGFVVAGLAYAILSARSTTSIPAHRADRNGRTA
jgi:NCS1 family nucleobase:cation symporter-1